MSQSKTERQLNLVICLLATRRFLSAQEIRATVHGYGDVESDTAFKRMFERDKKELRDAGIPIVTGRHDPLSDEDGYRIARDDYELPPIDLRPDEAAVLGLAARAWRHAVLGEAAANALLKLRSVGVPVDAAALPAVTSVLGADEPAFPSVWQAVRDRRPISFDYRKPGEDTPQRRELEPWGVANVAGHWYVAGYDRDRRARRVFRLSRIVGDVQIHTSAPPVQVPKDVDVRSLINARPPEPEQVAVLEARTDAAHALRRAARRIVAGERTGGTGWDVVEYPYVDEADLAARVAEYGEHVVVREPEQARKAVVAHLRAVVAAPVAAATDEDPPAPLPGTPRPPASRRAGTSTEQLRRLLMLVPYALSHDVRVSEVAAHFGLTEKQVLKDLSLLWMCGLPGYTPGDLIDVDVEAAAETGEIIISNADTLAAPLRLTADEAGCACSVTCPAWTVSRSPGWSRSSATWRALPASSPTLSTCAWTTTRRSPSCGTASAKPWSPVAESTCATCPAMPTGSANAKSTRCGWSCRTGTTFWKGGVASAATCGCSAWTGFSNWTCCRWLPKCPPGYAAAT